MHMSRSAFSVLALAALTTACSRHDEPIAPTPAPHSAAASTPAPAIAAPDTHSGIAWKYASSVADVDAAFAQARAETKPVFVYWGAKWCPPCNQVKATLFNRRDFIERSRAFVPVYVDGDAPGAQKLGAHFKVSGYPTMVLFSSSGVELTRLPGEVDAQRYTQVLTLGMNAQRPVKEVLAQALGNQPRSTQSQGLSANDWKLLAFYSWDTDEQQLAPRERVPAVLKRLADTCPSDQTETSTRLRLQSLAATDAKAPAQPDPGANAMLIALLADPGAARVQMDVLTNNASDIIRALSVKGSPQRIQLTTAFEAALKRFEADNTLSRADRLSALISQVDLAKIDVPAQHGTKPVTDSPTVMLPRELLNDVRDQAARADLEITDGYERQAVITEAAYMLTQAGLAGESDVLLEANLTKSHSPYYLMSELAGNARARGDSARALDWYEKAFDKSEGPATRLQWGASYVNALIDLAPQGEARIEKASGQLLTEAGASPDAFYERSGHSLQRVGAKLQGWNKNGAHSAVLARLQVQLGELCSTLDTADIHRAACESLLKPSAKKRT
jgi:thioredoxin-like negative regulator of GroEL